MFSDCRVEAEGERGGVEVGGVLCAPPGELKHREPGEVLGGVGVRGVLGQTTERLRSQSNMESLNSVLRIGLKSFKQNDVI